MFGERALSAMREIELLISGLSTATRRGIVAMSWNSKIPNCESVVPRPTSRR